MIAFCQALFPWYVGIITILASLLILSWLAFRVYDRIVQWLDLGPALVEFFWNRVRARKERP